jgi:branched-chain amino acid transport system ATP-binding protein
LNLLTVEDVFVTFGGLRALDGASLAVQERTIAAVIGPNGAGKTTLFNFISGLQHGQGRVRLADADLTGMAPNKRAGLGLARSFQNLGLMRDETVLTNVLAAQHLSRGYRGWDIALRPMRTMTHERHLRARAEAVLTQLDLMGYANDLAGDLSFGTARFVEMAAIVAQQPRLMLLDEPTTGLDQAEAARLRRLLLALRDQGSTVLLVAHDVRFVMGTCDHVFVLAQGRNLSSGAPIDIQSDQAVIDAYLGRAS